MLPNDLSVTFDSSTYDLKKVKEQNGESLYRGTITFGTSQRDMVLSVKHTIPTKPGAKASSVVKLTMNWYDTDTGELERTSTSHIVLTNSSGLSGVVNDYGADLLTAIMQLPAFRDEFNAGAY